MTACKTKQPGGGGETAAPRGGRDPADSCAADRTRGGDREGAGERTRGTTSLEGCTEGTHPGERRLVPRSSPAKVVGALSGAKGFNRVYL